jgi:uncharacterized caspase-like protein
MRRVCAVGCGAFADARIQTLKNAASDAAAFFELAVDPALGAADPAHSILLEDCTQADLRATMANFLREMREGDEFVIYVAGHASKLPNGDLTFYCSDTSRSRLTRTTFPFSELEGLLRQYRRNRGVLIVDTCFAASAAELLAKVRADGGVAAVMPPFREGLQVMWACGAEALAFEGSRHGLFTDLLLRAMRAGAGVSPSSEFVTPADAILWIRKELRAGSFEESMWPGFRTAGDHRGLYLSRNPSFRAGAATPAPAASAVRDLVLRLGLADPGEQNEFDRQRLLDKVRRHQDGHLLAGAANTGDWVEVVTDNTRQTLSDWLGSVWWAFATGWLRGEWRVSTSGPRAFVLASQEGFAYVDAGAKARPFVVLWSHVTAITRTQTPTLPDEVSVWFEPNLSYRLPQGTTTGFRRQVGRLEMALTRGWRIRSRELRQPGDGMDRVDPAARVSKTLAFLWGNRTYHSLTSLDAPPDDIARMRSLLESEADELRPCLDEPLDSCRQKIDDLFAMARGATVVFYFSGHGVSVDEELRLTVPETDPARLIETTLAIAELRNFFLEHHVGHLVLILDCCHSGAGADDFGVAVRSLARLKGLFAPDRENVTILAACSADESAWEVDGKGIFTDALVRAITTQSSATATVTVNDLMSRLPEPTTAQTYGIFASEAGLTLPLFGAGRPNAEVPDITRALRQHAADRRQQDSRELDWINRHVLQGRCEDERVKVFRCAPASRALPIAALLVCVAASLISASVESGLAITFVLVAIWPAWRLLNPATPPMLVFSPNGIIRSSAHGQSRWLAADGVSVAAESRVLYAGSQEPANRFLLVTCPERGERLLASDLERWTVEFATIEDTALRYSREYSEQFRRAARDLVVGPHDR